ncbi:hypothetical protein H0264_12545 [Nocardia huaxiensis]|uniref:Uncharacterized protein n=2 Tax=Nocardia huaxiensis TaxID=2755382 RepID=A0A7D6ZDJ6_9NOCA|nr:hypothetical protein [Nocardia huaxiensis]QLY32948.1 hypothetical protein H0264_12545 [Nocardia huaxiensis]
MADFMQHVFDHAKEFELQKLPQKHGPVRYLGMAENMPDPGLRRAMTTSDLAHPTEAVYQLIARQIVDVMLTKYTLGQLNPQSWPALRPYPNV